MSTFIHRALHDKVHILNYVTGENISVDAATGWNVLTNQGRLQTLGLDDTTISFFFHEEGFPNLNACRVVLNQMSLSDGFPTLVDIELNETCTPECMSGTKRCYFHQYKADQGDGNIFFDMSRREMEKIFNNLVEIGVMGVRFKGGEPFASPKLKDLLDITAYAGMISEIHTELSNYGGWIIEKTPFERLTSLRVLTRSFDPAIHDQMVGEPGSGAKFWKAFKELHRTKYHVELVYPKYELNSSTADIEAYCESEGVPFVSVNASEEKFMEDRRLHNVGLSDLQQAYFCAEHHDWIDYPDELINFQPSFRILANGDLTSGEPTMEVVGNIKNALPSQILQSAQARMGMPYFFDKSLFEGFRYESAEQAEKEPAVVPENTTRR